MAFKGEGEPIKQHMLVSNNQGIMWTGHSEYQT